MASCPCLSPPRPLQAEPFFFAARKISTGRGESLPLQPQQAKLFFIAATKIRIGRVIRCRYGCCRRNHYSLPLRRLESDAERCGGRDGCSRRNHSSLTLRRLESDAKQRRLNDRSRRNYSSLPLRKLESDAERCCGRDGCSRRNHSPLHRFPSLGLKSRIDARRRV